MSGIPCQYPVVWCPKYRRRGVLEGVDARCKAIRDEVDPEPPAEGSAREVRPDQVPLRVAVDPQFGIHRLVRWIQGWSSRLLRQEFPGLRGRLPTLWTHRDVVATVGGRAVIQPYL
jgi:putative transposase